MQNYPQLQVSSSDNFSASSLGKLLDCTVLGGLSVACAVASAFPLEQCAAAG